LASCSAFRVSGRGPLVFRKNVLELPMLTALDLYNAVLVHHLERLAKSLVHWARTQLVICYVFVASGKTSKMFTALRKSGVALVWWLEHHAGTHLLS